MVETEYAFERDDDGALEVIEEEKVKKSLDNSAKSIGLNLNFDMGCLLGSFLLCNYYNI